MEQLDQDLAAIITGKVQVLKPKGRPGRPPSTANIIGKMLNVPRRDVVHNGLNLVQTPEAWLCRYSNMMYHQEQRRVCE